MPYHSAKRAPRSCTECTRRKIRCERQYPCAACVKRGHADKLTSDTSMAEAEPDPVYVLQSHLQELNTQADSPEDLLVTLESLSQIPDSTHSSGASLTDIAQLYQPARPVVLMFLPDRRSSESIIHFALSHLTWIHCAIRAPSFEEQHRLFWDALSRGEVAVTDDHGWLSVYLSLLTAGLLFMEPKDRPSLQRLNGSGATSLEDAAASVMRMWYDVALQEFEASQPLSRPDIKTVQTVAILTLVHHYFDETEREYMLLGLAINTARCLNMHLLGRESDFPQRLRDQPVWATAQDRQLGRRLWWTLVICDWLGRFSNPCSISLVSFNTRLEPFPEDAELFPLTGNPPLSDAPSPLWHHIIMSRLAGLIYTHIKEPRNPDVAKLARCIDHVEGVFLQTSLRHSIPHNRCIGVNDTSWTAHQDYLITHTIQLLRVTISRAMLALWLKGSSTFDMQVGIPVINKGVDAASKIINHRMRSVPEYFLRSWIVSASTLAAGIYLAVHLICFKPTLSPDQVQNQRNLVETCAALVTLRGHRPNSRGSRSSTILYRLLGAESMEFPGVVVEKRELMRILQSAMDIQPQPVPPAETGTTTMASEATFPHAFHGYANLDTTMPPIDDTVGQMEVDQMWQTLMEEWFPPSPATIPDISMRYPDK